MEVNDLRSEKIQKIRLDKVMTDLCTKFHASTLIVAANNPAGNFVLKICRNPPPPPFLAVRQNIAVSYEALKQTFGAAKQKIWSREAKNWSHCASGANFMLI